MTSTVFYATISFAPQSNPEIITPPNSDSPSKETYQEQQRHHHPRNHCLAMGDKGVLPPPPPPPPRLPPRRTDSLRSCRSSISSQSGPSSSSRNNPTQESPSILDAIPPPPNLASPILTSNGTNISSIQSRRLPDPPGFKPHSIIQQNHSHNNISNIPNLLDQVPSIPAPSRPSLPPAPELRLLGSCHWNPACGTLGESPDKENDINEMIYNASKSINNSLQSGIPSASRPTVNYHQSNQLYPTLPSLSGSSSSSSPGPVAITNYLYTATTTPTGPSPVSPNMLTNYSIFKNQNGGTASPFLTPAIVGSSVGMPHSSSAPSISGLSSGSSLSPTQAQFNAFNGNQIPPPPNSPATVQQNGSSATTLDQSRLSYLYSVPRKQQPNIAYNPQSASSTMNRSSLSQYSMLTNQSTQDIIDKLNSLKTGTNTANQAVRKQADGNLIDLGETTIYNDLNSPSSGQNVLEIFDPLMAAHQLDQVVPPPPPSNPPTNNNKEQVPHLPPPPPPPSSISLRSSPTTVSISGRSPQQQTQAERMQDQKDSGAESSSSLRSSSSSCTKVRVGHNHNSNKLGRASSESSNSDADDFQISGSNKWITFSPTHEPCLPSPHSLYDIPRSSSSIAASSSILDQCLRVRSNPHWCPDEIVTFVDSLKRIRLSYSYKDQKTNEGIVFSPQVQISRDASMSVKLVIDPGYLDQHGSIAPEIFTCDITTSVEHITGQVLCSLPEKYTSHLNMDTDMEHFALKVARLEEYLIPGTSLAEYRYVHECIKFDRDVELVLCRWDRIKRSFARLPRDDEENCLFEPVDILPVELIKAVRDGNLQDGPLNTALEYFYKEVTSLRKEVANQLSLSDRLSTKKLSQAVHAVLRQFFPFESVGITEALGNVRELCNAYYQYRLELAKYSEILPSYHLDVSNPGGGGSASKRGSQLEIQNKYPEVVDGALVRLQKAVLGVIDLYMVSFPLAVRFDQDSLSDSIKSELVSIQDKSSKRNSAQEQSLYVNTDEPTLQDTPKFEDDVIITEIGTIAEVYDLHVGVTGPLPSAWVTDFADFTISLELFHGERRLTCYSSPPLVSSRGEFFPRLELRDTIKFDFPIRKLPREARLVISVHGRRRLQSDNLNTEDMTGPNAAVNSSPVPQSTLVTNAGQMLEDHRIRLAVGAIYVIDESRYLLTGDRLIGLWLADQLNPEIGTQLITSSSIDHESSFLIHLGFLPSQTSKIQSSNGKLKICFPDVHTIMSTYQRDHPSPLIYHDPSSLHKSIYKDLYDVLHANPCIPLRDVSRDLLWEKRHYLRPVPGALPRLLEAVPAWDLIHLPQVYSLLSQWDLTTDDAIILLLPKFPDQHVRQLAVERLESLDPDELTDYLPQLIQAVRCEPFLDCPLVKSLIQRALSSVKVSHQLYWELKESVHDGLGFGWRARILLNLWRQVVGCQMVEIIDNEEAMLARLDEVTEHVKHARDSQRGALLRSELAIVDSYLLSGSSYLPLSPAMAVSGLDLNACSYFPSNSLPLKLAFRARPSEYKTASSPGPSSSAPSGFGSTAQQIDVIYKVGDDLRQDMLTIQLIRLMDKLWLKSGLDLRMVTFDCISTGSERGMIEMVANSDTLRAIQTEYGLTGSFKDRPIAEWLRKHNPTELDYQRAVYNFTHSCAGYVVATYVLGICDRHNDNIMLTRTGHLFHIDFGKFLGDAQKMAGISRDRVPFVFTSDMAYVINKGDKMSQRFQFFIDLCCQAFNVLRNHSTLLISTISLLRMAGIKGISPNEESLQYVYKALLPAQSEIEAQSSFTRMIEESLESKSTKVNFFLHNLAQVRFLGGGSTSSAPASGLSFIPRGFTRETEDSIADYTLRGVVKVRTPEKQYFYAVEVQRESVHTRRPGLPDLILRTYREFIEFNAKLRSQTDDVPFSSLIYQMPRAGGMSRTNTKEVAERRSEYVNRFLDSLRSSHPDLRHSNLVYTFFHPILRDEEYREHLVSGTSGSSGEDNGRIYSATAGLSGYLSSALGQVGHAAIARAGSAFRTIPRDLQAFQANTKSIYEFGSAQIKLSVTYKNQSLIVMVQHCKNLPNNGSGPPDSYVKTYLIPDEAKQTKRKTRIIAASRHPTFNELLVYPSLPLEAIRCRRLQVSVWNADKMSGNTSFGYLMINLTEQDLNQEFATWYNLNPAPNR